MATNPQQKPDIKEVVFNETTTFSSQFVNGIYGSTALNGIISVSFFRDKILLPDKVYVEIKDNKAIKETKKVGGNYIRRDVFFEAILDVNTGKIIAEWLLNQVAEFEKIKENEPTTNIKS